MRFDSIVEVKRYNQLKLLEKAGEIEQLKRQKKYVFTVNGCACGSYKADFVYMHKKGNILVVEDVKGKTAPLSALFQLKRKLMHALYNINVTIVRM